MKPRPFRIRKCRCWCGNWYRSVMGDSGYFEAASMHRTWAGAMTPSEPGTPVRVMPVVKP